MVCRYNVKEISIQYTHVNQISDGDLQTLSIHTFNCTKKSRHDQDVTLITLLELIIFSEIWLDQTI